MFSQRTGWSREPAALHYALEARRAAGLPVLDLSASNPTGCELDLPGATLLAALGDTRALGYRPEPFGLPEARAAVCAYYRDHGAQVATPQVCLTTSTSEAYSFLFRLVCDPGDEVLIAQPGYPLFDFLADMENVRLVPYPLLYDHGWQIEPGAIEARLTPRTRAIVVIHPNNPTGHGTSGAERAALELICARHELALIVDEVFLDYPLPAARKLRSFAHGPHPALTFVLSGLSKVAALPQMKVAWIVTGGPTALRREACARLEVIADTFLSMNAPMQYALAAWLARRNERAAPVRARVQANLAALDRLLAHQPAITRLHLEAGWYAVLRVPALGADEELVLALLMEDGVLVHPGQYYGFGGSGWLVLSLLPPPAAFAQGTQAILTRCVRRMQGASATTRGMEGKGEVYGIT